MGESTPDRHDAALWLYAAARLVETDSELFPRRDLDQAAYRLINRACELLSETP